MCCDVQSSFSDSQVQSGLVVSLVETEAEGEAEAVVAVAGLVVVVVLDES